MRWLHCLSFIDIYILLFRLFYFCIVAMYFCFSLNVSRNDTYLFRIYNLCLFRLYIIYADLLNSKQRLWFPITILILLVSFKQNNDKRNFFSFSLFRFFRLLNTKILQIFLMAWEFVPARNFHPWVYEHLW